MSLSKTTIGRELAGLRPTRREYYEYLISLARETLNEDRNRDGTLGPNAERLLSYMDSLYTELGKS